MLYENIMPFFDRIDNQLCKSFSAVITAMLKSTSANTANIARAMSELNGKPFNTNDKAIAYLLSNKKFQINDKFWRCYFNMLFNMLKEQMLINFNEKIYIQVDFTSDCQDFSILSASIICGSRAVPLYFSMRNYQIKKGMHNQKKMEQAFIISLKHILSSKYQYVIVADRGFGNQRFMDLCEENNFEYVIRITPNMNIKMNKKEGLLEELAKEDGEHSVYVKSWKRNIDVIRKEKDEKVWYLVNNIKGLEKEEAVDIYKDRFKIEKCFQDLKSSGYDIESSKIEKYERFKRLLVLCCISHTLTVFTGLLISRSEPALKKRYPTHIKLISAFSPLQNALLQAFSEKR